MTAQEARQKAKQVNTDLQTGQLFKIMVLISNAVSKGEYSVYLYDTILNEDVKKHLLSEGYIVGQPQSHRNETMVKISW